MIESKGRFASKQGSLKPIFLAILIETCTWE